MLIRSVIDSRWGLVKRPDAQPRRRTRASTIRAVEVLPLVPVRWIAGRARCGSPSSSMKAWMRSSVGSSLVSGHRLSSASSASAYVWAGRAWAGSCGVSSIAASLGGGSNPPAALPSNVMRRVSRAALGVMLLLGIYLLAVAIIALPVAAAVYAIRNRYPEAVAGQLVGLAFVTTVGLLAGVLHQRRTESEQPGVVLDSGEQPRLWAEVRALSETVGTAVPTRSG